MMSVKAAFELFQFYLEAEMASLLVKMEADGTESNKKSPCRWNERDDWQCNYDFSFHISQKRKVNYSSRVANWK